MKHSLFAFIYLIRSFLPSQSIFYYLYGLLKFFSFILLSHNIKLKENDLYALPSLCLKLTFFGGNEYSSYTTNYFLACIVIISLLVILIISCLFVYVTLRHYPDNTKIDSISHSTKTIIKCISVIFTLIALASQHLIEFSTLGLLNVFIPSKSYLGSGMTTLTKYIVFFLCLLNAIIVLFISYSFDFLSNSLFMSLQRTCFSFLQMKLFAMNIIANVLLGVTTLIIRNDIPNHLIVNCCLLGLMLLIYLYLFRRRYEYYHINCATVVKLFLFNWCMLSALIELILYYLPMNEEMTQFSSFNKVGIELLSAIFLTYFTIHYMRKKYLMAFMTKVFNSKEIVNIDEIMAYQELLSSFSNGDIDFNKIMQVFNDHKDICENRNCQCNNISMQSWHDQKLNTKKNFFSNNTFQGPFMDFVLIGEQAIIRSIGLFNKQNKQASQIQLLLLNHIDYITSLKKENILGIYFAIQYINQTKISLSFWTKYLLYEFQNVIIQRIIMFKIEGTKKQINDKTNEEQTKRATWVLTMNDFNSYCFFVIQLRKTIIKNLECIKTIFQYRNSLSTKSENLSLNYSNCETFIKEGFSLRENNELIIYMIKSQKGVIRHYELAYLVSNYYMIIQKKIPKFVTQIFPNVLSFDYFIKNDNKINSYEAYKMSNPLMTFLDNNDQFIIRYISRRHCNELKYSCAEILGKDISILFPPNFYAKHHFMMKQFALFSSTKFKKTTFILDKERHIINIQMSIYSLPSLDYNIGLIISMKFPYLNTDSQSKQYTLFLDNDFRITNADELFEKDFFFTIPMLNLMNLSYCDFLCANRDNLNKVAQKLYLSTKTTTISEQIISTEEEAKLNSLFQVVKLETLMAVQNNIKVIRNSKQILYHERILKKKLTNNIMPLNKLIKELGLDIEWYSRTKFLMDRLNLHGSAKHFNVIYKFSFFYDIPYIIVSIKEKILAEHYIGSMNIIKKSFKHLGKILSEKKPNRDRILVKQNEALSPSITPARVSQLCSTGLNFLEQINLDPVFARPTTVNNEPKRVQFNVETFTRSGTVINKDNSSSSAITALNKSNSFALMTSSNKNDLTNQSNAADIPALKNQHHLLEERKIDLNSWVFNDYFYLFIKRSYKLILLIMISMSLLGFLFNKTNVLLSKNIFDINFYAVLLKADILYASMTMLICCDYADSDNEIGLQDQRWRLAFRGDEIIYHYNLLLTTLNNLSNQKSVSPLYSLLSTNSDYLIIQADFKTKKRQSLLSEELYYYHSFLSTLSKETSFQRCRVKEMFVNSRYEQMTEKDIPPNLEEESVFYVLKNTLYGISTNIEKLIITSNDILHLYHSNCKQAVIIYNCVLYAVSVMLLLNCLLVFLRDQKYIQQLLRFIYTKKDIDDYLDEELSIYLVALEDFNEKNCSLYEKKRDSDPNDKEDNLLLEIGQNIDKNDNNPQIHHDHEGNHSHHHHDDHSLVILSFSPSITRPKIFFTAIIGAISFTVTYMIILLIYIIENRKTFENLMFSNLISINVVDKIPTLAELIFYSKISASTNNINLITLPIPDYQKHIYSNYYNITIDTTENSIFNTLGNSNFAFIIYKSLEIKANLELFCSDQSNKNLLALSFNLWDRINEEGGVCMASSVDFLNDYPISSNNIISSFETIEDYMKKCRKYGNNIALNKFNSIIDFSLEQITNLYMDFALAPNTSMKIPSFLTNPIMVMIDLMVNDSLKRLTNVFYSTVLEDMSNLYNSANQYGLIYSLVLFLICILLFIFLNFYVARIIQHNKGILLYVKKFIQKMII